MNYTQFSARLLEYNERICPQDGEVLERDPAVREVDIVAVQGGDGGADVPRQPGPGTNCIKIGLPGKPILRKRKGLLEVLFS